MVLERLLIPDKQCIAYKQKYEVLDQSVSSSRLYGSGTCHN